MNGHHWQLCCVEFIVLWASHFLWVERKGMSEHYDQLPMPQRDNGQGGCHSHRLNSHSCYNRTFWPRILRKGWSHYTFLHIHMAIYFCKCVRSQWKFNVVNGQSPKNQRGQWSNPKKSWSKFWPAVTTMTIDLPTICHPTYSWITRLLIV